MTFCALSATTSFLYREKSSLEYTEMVAVNNYDGVLEQMSSYLQVTGNKATDDIYVRLQAQQQAYDSAKSQIESRLKIINAQIEGYQKAVDNNIKTECKLNISA